MRGLHGLSILAGAWALLGMDVVSGQSGILFPSSRGDGDPMQAGMLPLAGGRLATIAVVGSDPGRAILQSGTEVTLLGHDPVTRLTVLNSPENTVRPVLGSALKLEQGEAVYLPGQKRASRVVRWEYTFRGKVLPVALIRIHHPFETSPVPGTPLTNGKGEVVALCHEAAPEFGNGTYALPVEAVERMEHDLKAFGRVSPCWIGITVNSANPVLAIEMVRPGSPGAVAGVRKGDILLSVGPRRTSSYAEARDAFYYLVAGQGTTLGLLRGTKLVELTVIPEVHPAYAQE